MPSPKPPQPPKPRPPQPPEKTLPHQIEPFFLYRQAAPRENVGAVGLDGTFTMRSEAMPSHVADDGCLHVVADRGELRRQLSKLDLRRARVLTRLSDFWDRRVR